MDKHLINCGVGSKKIAEPPEHENRRASMHAALMHLTIDPALAPAAAAAFTNEILPGVRAAPGFLAGYWVDPVDCQGFGFLLFETEEQALTATPPTTTWSAPGVSILRTEVRRVAVAIP
jgi:hypothetical protein